MGSSTSISGSDSSAANAKNGWLRAEQRASRYAQKGSLSFDEIKLIARDIGRGQTDIPHPGRLREHPARLTSGDFRDLPPPNGYLEEYCADYEYPFRGGGGQNKRLILHCSS